MREGQKGNENARKTKTPKQENSVVSDDTGLFEEKTGAVYGYTRPGNVERQRTKLAEATGIGESTAGRALAIAHKRPDLLDQVRYLSALPVNFPTLFSVFRLRSYVYTL